MDCPVDSLRAHASSRPEKVAIWSEGASLTYRQLWEEATSLAGRMGERGISAGRSVAFLGANGLEPAVAYFAASLLRAVFVILPADRPVAGLGAFLRLVEPAAIVLGRTARGRPYPAESALRPGMATILATAPGDVPAASPPATPPRGTDRSPHLVLFTSGSTGAPKGVLYNEAAYALATGLAVEGLGIVAEDVLINPYPAHHYGGIQAISQAALAGATLVQVALPSPHRILDAIGRHRGSFIVAVPTLWRRIFDLPGLDDYDLSSLRMANAASDFASPDLWSEIERRTGAVSIQGYGLTETGMVTLVPVGQRHAKPGSSGVADPASRVAIFGADGRTFGANRAGEVRIRSGHMMDGYHGNPAATQDAFEDGWFVTGDRGHLDDDGYLFITGRIKHTISCGAEKIDPGEVEDALRRSPGVRSAAVIGIPDRDLGHVPAALVEAPGRSLRADYLIEWTGEALGASRRVRRVFFVAEVPLTGSGKVDRPRATDLIMDLIRAEGRAAAGS